MSQGYDLVIVGAGIVGVWAATEAAARGARVALVETGPTSLTSELFPRPSVRFAQRENLGATRARHHVLTGNSAYWGGGLCRNDDDTLCEMFLLGSSAEAEARLSRHYDAIERTLGIHPPSPAAEVKPLLNDLSVSEIAVLPGKRRGLWSGFAERVREGRSDVACFCDATIQEVTANAGEIAAMTVATGSRQVQLKARLFVIAAGVVDSNLIALRSLGGILSEKAMGYVATRLHDHWSVPVASVRWRNGTPLTALFPPKFQRGGIIGRRSCDTIGFFHFTANLDELPPYDRVKKFLAARQKGQPFGDQARVAMSTMGRPFLMARAGMHYLAHRELFIPDGCEITLTFDFQSASSPMNRILLEGDQCVMEWDIRPEDIDAFGAVIASRRAAICQMLASQGLEVDWLAGDGGTVTSGDYLSKAAIDAYHLGGGLQVCGPDGDGVVDSRFVAHGTKNLYVLGTANFRRPGLANPVLTLLAQAEQFAIDHFGERITQ